MTAPARTVLLAAPRSFCAGVERAIEIVERALRSRRGPVFVRKQIVHNSHVVADLEKRGAVFVDELDEIPAPPPAGATLVFSAHGVSPAVRAEAERRGLRVVDGTCPLVSKVHAEARRFAARGDQIVLIGHAGHEEVDGIMGEAREAIQLVQTPDDVAEVKIGHPGRVVYLTQTTLAVDETAAVIDRLREKYPQLQDPPSDDICYATTNRQDAVKVIAARSDVVLVVGSGNSSNSVRLVEVVRAAGTPAYLVEDAGSIDPAWLATASVVGLTAGASAPQHLVDEVIDALGTVTVVEHEVTDESVRFAVPRIER